MSVLTGAAIDQVMAEGQVEITPAPTWLAGPNSIDLRLGPRLYRYDVGGNWFTRALYSRFPSLAPAIDPTNPPPLVEVLPDSTGSWVLRPGILYIGSTLERTRVDGFVPYLDGRSSLGRLGVFAHVTAGRGDDGWDGCWTVELVAVQKIKLTPGMRAFQLTLHQVTGERRPYRGRYQGDTVPVASRFGLPSWDAWRKA